MGSNFWEHNSGIIRTYLGITRALPRGSEWLLLLARLRILLFLATQSPTTPSEIPSETPTPMTPAFSSAKSNESDCSSLTSIISMLDVLKAPLPAEIACKRKLKVTQTTRGKR